MVSAESSKSKPLGVLLVGNPNVGKSAIFAKLTGTYVTVANYPGTTVDISRGRFNYGHEEYEIIDTPGVYSLQPQSEDEIVTRDIILESPDAIVVLVLDAKNLHRGLVLAQQLSELTVPFCVALNMMDEAAAQRIDIDVPKLQETLGVDVVPTVATTGRGLKDLENAIGQARVGHIPCSLPPELRGPVGRITESLRGRVPDDYAEFLALGTLIEPGSFPAYLSSMIDGRIKQIVSDERRNIAREFPDSLSSIVSAHRQRHNNLVLTRSGYGEGAQPGGFAVLLGRLATHPVWGAGISLLILLMVYYFVGVFGAGVLVGLLEEGLFEKLINPAMTWLVAFIPFASVREFLVGPYGLVTMALTYSLAIILPVVGTFFIAFGILEDSGYMPRLAVMANRIFKRMGLHGKAVLPMILGLGCDTMATLTARILDTRRERMLVTLLLALGVPCSAQLAVIFGMLSSVSFVGLLIWLGVVTLVMISTGAIASKLLPGQNSDFILELPPMRIPSLKNILVKTAMRIEWYLKEAVPLFVLGTVILFALDRLSALQVIRNVMAPVVSSFLGLPQAAADAFLIGFLRRDYGAAGLLDLQRQGLMDGRQVVVSLVIITLFVPCIANFFVMIKERGLKASLVMGAVIILIALSVGGLLNWTLLTLGLNL
jgi:ferrous iron transport protein B